MVTAAAAAPAASAAERPIGAPGGRERKKARTRADLATAARRLTFARGLEAVTIQQIVEAADVSTRTFFNYFRCKEAAVVGVEPGLVAELADSVRLRPLDEPPIVALTRALLENASGPDVAEGWAQRSELVRRHPTLLPRHLEAMSEVEEALTVAVAERMGTSVEDDLTPSVMVSAVVGVMRSTFAWWMRTTPPMPLATALASGFAAVSAGFADDTHPLATGTPSRRSPRTPQEVS
jgi:AcrR family transcriptional regulator